MEQKIIAAVRCNKMAKCLRKIYNKDIWLKNLIFKSFHWDVGQLFQFSFKKLGQTANLILSKYNNPNIITYTNVTYLKHWTGDLCTLIIKIITKVPWLSFILPLLFLKKKNLK